MRFVINHCSLRRQPKPALVRSSCRDSDEFVWMPSSAGALAQWEAPIKASG